MTARAGGNPQYARLVQAVTSIGLDPAKFGTHSLRRTKVLIYRHTGNLRAVQLLLGHSKIESTVRYLGIEVDDAIEIAEKIDSDAVPPLADVVGDGFGLADHGAADFRLWDEAGYRILAAVKHT